MSIIEVVSIGLYFSKSKDLNPFDIKLIYYGGRKIDTSLYLKYHTEKSYSRSVNRLKTHNIHSRNKTLYINYLDEFFKEGTKQ